MSDIFKILLPVLPIYALPFEKVVEEASMIDSMIETNRNYYCSGDMLAVKKDIAENIKIYNIVSISRKAGPRISIIVPGGGEHTIYKSVYLKDWYIFTREAFEQIFNV